MCDYCNEEKNQEFYYDREGNANIVMETNAWSERDDAFDTVELANILFCPYCGRNLKDKKVYPSFKNDTKQVIVMRRDLKNTQGHKVRTGKLIAQGAHASLKVFFDRMVSVGDNKYQIEMTDAMIAWDNASYVKICLGVDSEEELMDVYRKALQLGLPVALIRDNGMTEFGEPTYTCLAIGPDENDAINQVTGTLKLF